MQGPNIHLADEWAAAAWKRFNLTIPVNLDTVRKSLHLYVRRQSLPESESGFILQTAHRHYIILNDRQSPERQAFTMAHEIGEFLLMRHLDRNGRKLAQGKPKEKFCDRFAANLLMPADQVRDAASRLYHNKKTNDKTCAVAHQFGVSIQAMSYRLSELGINPKHSRHCNDLTEGKPDADFQARLDAFADEMKAMVTNKNGCKVAGLKQ